MFCGRCVSKDTKNRKEYTFIGHWGCGFQKLTLKQKEGETLTSEVITSRLLRVHLPLMTVAIHLIRILEE